MLRECLELSVSPFSSSGLPVVDPVDVFASREDIVSHKEIFSWTSTAALSKGAWGAHRGGLVAVALRLAPRRLRRSAPQLRRALAPRLHLDAVPWLRPTGFLGTPRSGQGR